MAKKKTTKGRTSAGPKPTESVFQFKITLLEVQPPIWRRIRIKDCMLDKLHEYIQASMGWTNSHLHQFTIGNELYADPMLMRESFELIEFEDSTTTLLSDIIPEGRILYEYDFGDSWQHEILFEGSPKEEADRTYPICLEGERACPPEDVGGVWGYADFLEAVGNPKHPQV